ncbi:MAG: MFS transporter [Chloroflexota bacterium]
MSSHPERPEVGTQDLTEAGNVFRNRQFVSLWSAQVLSQLASNMVLAGLMAIVDETTHSATANALLILTFLVPAVLFSTGAGAIIERTDARLIMLGSNIARAVGTILFIFVAADASGANIPLVFGLNFLIAIVTAFFAPAELTAIPRIVERRHLMAANSIFVLTINATFAIGFGFLGPLLLKTTGPVGVYITVAIMFGLAAAAIIPIPSVPPEPTARRDNAARRAVRDLIDQMREGVAFVRKTPRIAWSLSYLGIAASLIGVMGAVGPTFARDVLGLSSQDFFFVVGPAGLGAVIGILFLNAYGGRIPKRLVVDIGLIAMGITLILLAIVKPLTSVLQPAVGPIEVALPDMLAPILSLVALVVAISMTAGVEYAFVAIPSQTALQEELPADVRGRIFGILNTLLSLASFLPVVAAPIAADLLNIAFPGAGLPIVMAVLGIATLVAGWFSWRHNARAGLHGQDAPTIGGPPPTAAQAPIPGAQAVGGRRRRRRPASDGE